MVSSKALQRKIQTIIEKNIRESYIITEEASGLSFADILADKYVDDSSAEKALNMAERRISGEPLQYIIGHWPFRNLDLKIGPGVLIPRPETELIIDIAEEIMADNNSSEFLDLCCGSGNIAIALNTETGIQGTAVDISHEAVEYCRINAELNSSDIEIVEADIFDFYSSVSFKRYGLIISNPPYVSPEDYRANYDELSYEPVNALVPPDGDELLFYRRIIDCYYGLLTKNGAFVFECGNRQAAGIMRIADKYVFKEKKTVKDLNGLDRFTILYR